MKGGQRGDGMQERATGRIPTLGAPFLNCLFCPTNCNVARYTNNRKVSQHLAIKNGTMSHFISTREPLAISDAMRQWGSVCLQRSALADSIGMLPF